MKPKLSFISFLVVFSAFTLTAQQTTVYTEANKAYKRGMEFYEKGIYNLSQQEFYTALTQLRPVPEPEARLLRGKAELYYAKAAVRSGQPNGEQLMLDYIRTYIPDPLAAQASIEMGDYYFNQNKPDKAFAFYDLLEPSDMAPAQRDQLYFKKGYCYFVTKKFKEAKGMFSKIKDNQSFEYFNETNYYYGMCSFFDNNLDDAARSFQRVQNSKQYAAVVPYNLVQIYAAQKDYNKVLQAGLQALEDPKVKNAKAINQLVGQAYFERKNYTEAEKYLMEGADGNNAMREEDFYQLGFSQHRNGHFKEAAQNLENLNRTNTKLGQHGMYLLGDAYLRLGDRPRAKNAFATSSRMNFDPSVQEESKWNYGKLTYELKQTQEAVDALGSIPQGSKYYNEAQSLLSDALLKTRNYDEAVKVISNSGNRTPQVREAFQKATLYRAMQYYEAGDFVNAKIFLERSLEDAPDANAKAMANYWLGDIYHNQKDYQSSQRYMGNFLAVSKTLTVLPSESSIHMANYIQGYNYLRQKNYQQALTYFQDCVNGIKREYNLITNDNVKNQVLGDATLRLGDSYFKRNKYDEAMRFYDEAINKKYSGFVYALYQKGMIQGLKGNNVEKLIALERLVKEYPNSEFSASALFEMGATYQNLNQLDKAAATFTYLVSNFKSRADLVSQALLRLGLIAQNKGNNDAAISYYKQVFYNNPSPADAKAALERLQDIYVNDLGKPDEYFAFLQTIPGYNIDNMAKDSISYRSAEIQYEQGNYQKAITSYTTYLSKYPNSPNSIQAYYNRAESYAALKEFDEALTDYESVVLKGSSKFYVKAVEKGALIAYNFKKDFTKSFDLYSKMEKAATSDDKRFEAELGAMRSAYRLNKPDAVSEFAQKVLNSGLASKEQVATAGFYLGKNAYDRNEFDKAQQAFQKTIKNGGNDEQTAEARYLDAVVDYKKRNLDVALDKADKASQNNAYQFWAAKCVILQADIYAEKNDLFSARAALESVIDGVKEFPEITTEAKQKLANLEKKESVKSRISKPQVGNTLELEKNEGNR
jgi:tetratricopeptide (TPR) repeat protein